MRIVCPTCKKVVENAPPDFPPRPFCSPSCKLADLHNWLSGRYRSSQPILPGQFPSGEGDEDDTL